MNCPTCGVDMNRLNAATIYGDYSAQYCDRCGTLVEHGGKDDPEPPMVTVPLLVSRCRAYENTGETTGMWEYVQIPSCLHTPK